MRTQKEIKATRIIAAEGEDAMRFMDIFLKTKNISDAQVFDFGGNNELALFLHNLQLGPRFNEIRSIVIARDSEQSTSKAISEVNESLIKNNLIDSEIKPFSMIEYNGKKICFTLFPGYNETHELYQSGTLEDLCLKLFKNKHVIDNIDRYLIDFLKNRESFKRHHKNRLYAAFSFTDEYVGKLIGKTAELGGFDFDAESLKPFLDIFEKM